MTLKLGHLHKGTKDLANQSCYQRMPYCKAKILTVCENNNTVQCCLQNNTRENLCCVIQHIERKKVFT